MFESKQRILLYAAVAGLIALPSAAGVVAHYALSASPDAAACPAQVALGHGSACPDARAEPSEGRSRRCCASVVGGHRCEDLRAAGSGGGTCAGG